MLFLCEQALVNQNWNLIYLDVSTKSDELWLLTDNIEKVYKDNMRLVVFQISGAYLSDNMFNDAAEYIYSLSNTITSDCSENYFKCINANIDRLDNERIIQSLCNMLSRKQFVSCDVLQV